MTDEVRAEIVYLSALEIDPENANLGTEAGSLALDASIEEFDFIDAGTLDRNNRIIGGNKRRQSAERLGHTQALVIEHDGKMPVYLRVKDYDLSDPNDVRAKRAAIALNRVGQLSLKWDKAQLAEFMENGISLDDLFDGDVLPNLGGKKAVRDAPVTAESLRQEIHKKWQTTDAEIWHIGPHTIICGDAADPAVWSHVPTCHGIFTSPPYAEQRKGRYESIPESEYLEWFVPIQANIAGSLADDGSFFLNLKPHSRNYERSIYVMELVVAMKRSHGWAYVDEFCWERACPPGSWPNRFKNGFEPVHHFALNPKVKFRPKNVLLPNAGVNHKTGGGTNTDNHYNVVDGDSFSWSAALPSNRLSAGSASGVKHSAAFPVDLPLFFVRAFSDEGDVWCDPFLGSGTTILAADAHGCIGYGIEKDPVSVAVALERLSDALDVTPEKVSDALA